MTDEELKKLVASLVRAQAATNRQMAETDKRIAESHKEIEAVNKQLSKQLGELGNKFGSFTEGLAWPALHKLLIEQFKLDTVGPRVIKHLNGRTLELDVLAYANGEINAVYVVEVKSHLRAEGVRQTLRMLQEFLHFFPEHRGKRVYGILAAVDVPKAVRKQALEAGLYLARIHDENFQLDVPANFQAKDFSRTVNK